MNRRSYSTMVRTTRNYFRLNCGVSIALFITGTLFAVFGNNFLIKTNMVNLLRTCTTNCYLAIGVQLAVILADIDLAGGALAALSGIMCVATFESFGLPIPMGIAVGILMRTFTGLINGVIIAYTEIHPFVVTLAMQSVCRGVACLIANGSPITTENTNFGASGTSSLEVVPYPVTYVMILLVMNCFLLSKLRTGRHIYAIGGNGLSARFSGINVRKIKILVWTISGTIADFYEVVLAARFSSGQSSAEGGYETDAIAAAMLGRTSFFGGTGAVDGLMIRVLVINVISNGLNLMHVNSHWQFVLKDVVTIATVYFGILKQEKQNTSR